MENIDVPQRFIEKKTTKEGKKQNSKKTVTQ